MSLYSDLCYTLIVNLIYEYLVKRLAWCISGTIASRYRRYIGYGSTHSTTITTIQLLSDLHSQKTNHTSPLRANYGVSFVSYTKKNDCDTSRAHWKCINTWTVHGCNYNDQTFHSTCVIAIDINSGIMVYHTGLITYTVNNSTWFDMIVYAKVIKLCMSQSNNIMAWYINCS